MKRVVDLQQEHIETGLWSYDHTIQLVEPLEVDSDDFFNMDPPRVWPTYWLVAIRGDEVLVQSQINDQFLALDMQECAEWIVDGSIDEGEIED